MVLAQQVPTLAFVAATPAGRNDLQNCMPPALAAMASIFKHRDYGAAL